LYPLAYLAAMVAVALAHPVVPQGRWLLIPLLLLGALLLGALLTLWPTVLRTCMVDGTGRGAIRALPLCLAGLVCLGVGTLAWWPVLAATGLALFAAAVVLLAVPGVATARRRPPGSFAAWSIADGTGWLLVALICDAAALLSAPGAATAADRFDTVLLPLGGGFVAQVLLGGGRQGPPR
jgi:hypothetical protein